MKRIGVDVGGTFTDLILVDEEANRISVDKIASTPEDPSRAVVEGVERLVQRAGVSLSEVDGFLHGTTVATNIVLTNTGAETGMITTEGFRDIIHIARHKRPYNFSLQQELPWQSRPLVKRRNRLTVAERVTAPHGEVITPLDEDEVRQQVRELRESGVESIVVCLLHSYLNPEHERRIKKIVEEEYPEVYLSVSHEVLPLYREFERFSTVSLNGYVGPKVSSYVSRLDTDLADAGYAHGVRLMQSSGGLTTVEGATERPVSLLMSGVVAGLLGGIWVGRMAGHQNVVTLDMGGTSADIGVAAGGELRMRHLLDTKIGDYQAMIPMVDIDTIGAGGGSIAYVDDGGVFRVGPQSAGADPGPACYGHGGTEPTSTDAQLLLGRLRPDRGLLGGDMHLSAESARAAFEPLAKKLDMSVEEAALGALQIQRYGMTQAIELNSVRRGYDPRDFALVAAGGAGALFSCEIAQELEIPTVLVPPHPGITSATGLLTTDLQHEFVATDRHALDDLDSARLQGSIEDISRQATQRLVEDGVPEDRRLVNLFVEARYEGQGYEVRCDAPGGTVDEAWIDRLRQSFHAAHEVEYGHRFEAPIEIVNLRAVGVGRIDELEWPKLEQGDGDPGRARKLEQDVVFEVEGAPERVPTPFFDRELLRAGDRISGPAVIEQYDATTTIPPGFEAEIDGSGNIAIATPAASDAGQVEASSALSTPIRMRVIGGALSSIAKEMAGVLFRMSYSSIIRESEDLGAGLFDAEGNVLSESDSTPMFMGAMPKIVKNIISVLGDDIHDGDIIVHNDPYGGATHSPDLAIVIPIFSDGDLVGFSGASAHLLDIGGAFPGIAVDLVDRWSEGSIFQAVKLSEKGVRQEGLWRHILNNMRTPTQNKGDLDAMIAACELARRRFLELLGKYGTDTVLEAADAWLDYSERMLRQEITKLPDGVYETETGWLDDDGVNRGVKLPVKVKVIVEGDTVTFDLTGSSKAVPTGFNCAFEGSTVSAMSFIARMIFLDEEAYPVFVPQNEGMLRPVEVVAPEGSIFNPDFPHATLARFCQVQRAVDLVLRALAPVAPERVTAGNSAHLHFLSYSGFTQETGEYWVYLEVNDGSYGGRHHRDGLDSVGSLIENTRNNPIEELEWRYPMRTERYELRDHEVAAGEWRGGLGVVRVNRFLADTVVSCEGERQESDPPWGIFGGQEGRNASLYKNRGEDDEESWPAKITGYKLAAGDSIEITTPSSGGFGDPLDRDPWRVSSDVLDGFTTIEIAESMYGVVIDPEQLVVDEQATAERRKAKADS
jgi:5-oxoprolinase (ATP-hydrolysing)